jgi:outer membrane cobalamin receptor
LKIRLLIFLPLIGFSAISPAAAAPPPDDDDEERTKPETDIIVTARRLDIARANVEPSLGASTYTLTNEALQNRPGGETTKLGQVLLQVPGVAQEGSGKLSVRGAHGDPQFRINNVIVPEGIADFGERLSPRLADRIELIRGALPAQYGLQVGGVVNITTKSGTYADGGQAEIYGGSHGEIEPAFEYAATSGATSLFASGSYLRSNVGLSSPDGSAHPLHDRTNQFEGFAFVDHVIDAQSRVSLIAGASDERFQIPNIRGLNARTYAPPGPFQRPLTANGVSDFPSEELDGHQSEASRFGILSYIRTTTKATIQASLFVGSSTKIAAPDELGTLLFSGVSRSLDQSDVAAGLQLEGVYNFDRRNALRAGVVLSAIRERSRTRTLVLPVDALGRQTSEMPIAIDRAALEHRKEASLFLQDEWKPLEGLTLNFGARLDHVGGPGGGTKLGPRASIVWAPREGTILHAGYARYFVPPPGSSQEAILLRGTSGALPTATGSALRPETDNYYDAGIQEKLGALTVGIDAYWRDAANLLEERQLGSSLISRAFNYETGRVRGVELSLTYSEGPFSAWSNLAIADAKGRRIVSNQFDFTPAQLAYLGAHEVPLNRDQTYTASGGASYRLGKLRLSGDFIYGSGFRRTPTGGPPNTATLPGYLQVDFAAVFHMEGLGDRPLDLRLDLANVFDRKYQIRDGSGLAAVMTEWGRGGGASWAWSNRSDTAPVRITRAEDSPPPIRAGRQAAQSRRPRRPGIAPASGRPDGDCP